MCVLCTIQMKPWHYIECMHQLMYTLSLSLIELFSLWTLVKRYNIQSSRFVIEASHRASFGEAKPYITTCTHSYIICTQAGQIVYSIHIPAMDLSEAQSVNNVFLASHDTQCGHIASSP